MGDFNGRFREMETLIGASACVCIPLSVSDGQAYNSNFIRSINSHLKNVTRNVTTTGGSRF